ncbi:hypothetical protein A6769_37265 [Nostoc punctiforme NIES-2108]|uniref:Uncharacterized protein n=1 Tax=Nostoc punctiforme NIES-2108 TaxID=1356359 RepID=A0A367S1A7_NOSPU|nr:hypothetical protein A6769_37265 [Nostoc punctiforme NIES-2108]
MTTKIANKLTNNIDFQIEQTQGLINNITEQIKSFENELIEYQDSLDLIINPPKYAIQQDLLLPLKALQNIVNESNSESERVQKIELLKQSLRASNQSLASKKSELLNLENDLTRLQEQKHFNDNYLIHIDKFSKEYTKTNDKLQRQIDSTRDQLKGYQSDLEFLKIWQSNKEYRLPHNLISKASDTFIARLENEIIPNCQRSLIQLVQQLNNYDKLNDPEFQKWLVQRVNIDKSLTKFLEIQNSYIESLKILKRVVNQNPDICNFSVNQLPGKLVKVKLENGTVILEN